MLFLSHEFIIFVKLTLGDYTKAIKTARHFFSQLSQDNIVHLYLI